MKRLWEFVAKINDRCCVVCLLKRLMSIEDTKYSFVSKYRVYVCDDSDSSRVIDTEEKIISVCVVNSSHPGSYLIVR